MGAMVLRRFRRGAGTLFPFFSPTSFRSLGGRLRTGWRRACGRWSCEKCSGGAFFSLFITLDFQYVGAAGADWGAVTQAPAAPRPGASGGVPPSEPRAPAWTLSDSHERPAPRLRTRQVRPRAPAGSFSGPIRTPSRPEQQSFRRRSSAATVRGRVVLFDMAFLLGGGGGDRWRDMSR